MSGFGKIFKQIFKSSIADNYEVRWIFMDLCVLCDWEGVLDMTYDAIARETNVPIEKIVSAIGELMKPDPRSRSGKLEGARLVPLDPKRNWGWRIVNYPTYRGTSDQAGRRAYRRNWMREKRKQEREQREQRERKREQREQGVNNHEHRVIDVNRREQRGQNYPGKSVNSVNSREQRCTQSDSESDSIIPPAVPLKGGQPIDLSLFITSVEEAKKLICQRILGGKDPTRPWSYEVMEALARQLPIPRVELERIAWFRSLSNDGSPELANRREVTQNGLLIHWSDEFSRADAFWQKCYGWRQNLKQEGAA